VTIYSQKEDNIWLLGTSSVSGEFDGLLFGNTTLDFSDIEPKIYYDSLIQLDFAGTNASICDNEGALLLYSNGMQIQSGQHVPIHNGDTIAYSNLWDNFVEEDFLPNGDDWLLGFKVVQGALILPHHDDYYIFYHEIGDEYDPSGLLMQGLDYSKVCFIDSEFTVVQKDVDIISDRLNYGKINACRHANGEDWWIIQQTIGQPVTYLLLLSKGQVVVHDSIHHNDIDLFNTSVAQCYFDPTGSKYAIVDTEGFGPRYAIVSLYDFDRCTGELSSASRDTFIQKALTGVVSFSPSGQFLYTSSYDTIFQYDIWENEWQSTKESIAVYDSFYFQQTEFSDKEPTLFGTMALGPDNRIYSIAPGNNRYMHTIEFPDEFGINANVRQHKIYLPTQNFNSIPNFPHYRLGPIDGSTCDTLGHDNNPQAGFRLEADTSNHRNIRFTDVSFFEPDDWTWDFGDGTTYTGKRPYYHEYSEDGAYEVCLTVSNQNSSDTYCKTIYIGVTSIDTQNPNTAKILIGPNPVDQALHINLTNLLPHNGRVHVYDYSGHLVKTAKLNYGLNSVDIIDLTSGLYFIFVFDENRLLKTSKVVKL